MIYLHLTAPLIFMFATTKHVHEEFRKARLQIARCS